ncbi:hypothetical protein QYM36_014901 [Artemia franciscana]|uniref:Uncharacterized protein n=1 Tax=Artemia franciscana TaxID=6661 RepID=A0AA88HLI3_ARTSF|nr:hypothetical protein QYM36_014901 [Artemia franciscana]
MLSLKGQLAVFVTLCLLVVSITGILLEEKEMTSEKGNKSNLFLTALRSLQKLPKKGENIERLRNKYGGVYEKIPMHSTKRNRAMDSPMHIHPSKAEGVSKDGDLLLLRRFFRSKQKRDTIFQKYFEKKDKSETELSKRTDEFPSYVLGASGESYKYEPPRPEYLWSKRVYSVFSPDREDYEYFEDF